LSHGLKPANKVSPSLNKKEEQGVWEEREGKEVSRGK
jgi:hypothetical protein